jgi:hypothetical protein
MREPDDYMPDAYHAALDVPDISGEELEAMIEASHAERWNSL